MLIDNNQCSIDIDCRYQSIKKKSCELMIANSNRQGLIHRLSSIIIDCLSEFFFCPFSSNTDNGFIESIYHSLQFTIIDKITRTETTGRTSPLPHHPQPRLMFALAPIYAQPDRMWKSSSYGNVG